MRSSLPRSLALLSTIAVAACTTKSPFASRLPFHVAIAPVVIHSDSAPRPPAGRPTDLALAFDPQRVMTQLDGALAQTFSRVSRLPPDLAGTGMTAAGAWIAAAQQQGADLLLVPTLRFDPRVHTDWNDRFWLNLPLFAIGGPFCWFVADRSYFCTSRLDGELYDLGIATARQRQSLDPVSRLLRVEREATEASLNFLQRASSIDAWVLSTLCPAGLLATESAAVPTALDIAVAGQLCNSLTRALQDRTTEITESELVDFHPRLVRVVRAAEGDALVGEIVLRLGEANELGRLRYRASPAAAWQELEWQPAATTAARGQRVYAFRIPLAPGAAEVQVDVEQLDRFATRRSFTFAIGEPAGW